MKLLGRSQGAGAEISPLCHTFRQESGHILLKDSLRKFVEAVYQQPLQNGLTAAACNPL